MPNPAVQTITLTEMRAINRGAVLELIRSNGPISRAEIAARLPISLPTLKGMVAELIAAELVRVTATSAGRGGRKQALLEFNGAAHLVIGLDLGGTKLYGAVADLNGAILHELHISHHQTQSEESYELLCGLLDELMVFARESGKHLRGVGVGVPGVVSPSGQVELAPSLEWNGFPLRQRLEERYRLPVVVKNDVNLAALGELWFGLNGEVENLVLMAIGTGIGAGVVTGGMVHPGFHGMAGEVGYLLPERACLGQAYPGWGALEQIASGTGIAAQAQRLFETTPPPEGMNREQALAISAEDVFTAARSGAGWAQAILAETIDTLAQAIAAISLVLDPEVILLGGGVSGSADLLVEPILARLRGSIPLTPRIQTARLGYRAAVMGSIVQLLRMTTNYYRVQKYG